MVVLCKASQLLTDSLTCFVSQVLQRALNCESRVKKSRSFPRSNEKSRNKHQVNMVEYSSELSDDEEVDMCVAEWS
jgi:hypothetical protein